MATTNKPLTTFRKGSVKAAIWQNESQYGPFYSTTFTRSYKDAVSGQWKNVTAFSVNDVEALCTLTEQVKAWLTAHPTSQ